MQRKTVDFPEPDSPTMPRASPAATSKLTSHAATIEPLSGSRAVPNSGPVRAIAPSSMGPKNLESPRTRMAACGVMIGDLVIVISFSFDGTMPCHCTTNVIQIREFQQGKFLRIHRADTLRHCSPQLRMAHLQRSMALHR